MGLFDKKYCDICGEKIGLLGNRIRKQGILHIDHYSPHLHHLQDFFLRPAKASGA